MSEELKWIKHDGGPMPVPGDTMVLIRRDDGLWLDDASSAALYEGTDPIDCDGDDWWKRGVVKEYAIVTPSPSAADPTNPAHYKTGDVECIDAIRAQLTPEQFKGYLKASLVKYVWRYEHKGAALADLEKGKWFLERLIGEVRDGSN